MVVTSQCDGQRVTGLYVGASNVKRYFRKGMATIELQLDHLRIACGLTPHFWEDAPEIQDPRLCAWLESKHRDSRGRRSPITMALIPTGNGSFILDAVNLEAHRVPSAKQKSHTSPGKALEERAPEVVVMMNTSTELDSPPPF